MVSDLLQSWYSAHLHRSLWKTLDLTKRTIHHSVSEAVARFQPETLILNKAITTGHTLENLLGQLTHCTVSIATLYVCLRYVAVVCLLDVDCIGCSPCQ